jgi:hypothetical protein
MSNHYLLPCTKCPPGVHVVVDSHQAGLTVQCTCGTVLQVPTFRELSRLAKSDAPARAEIPSTWTWRESLVLLGAVLAFVSLPLLWYVYHKTPPHPSTFLTPVAAIKTADGAEVADNLSKADAQALLGLWEELKVLPDTGRETLYVEGWRRQMDLHVTYYYIVGAVLALGVGIAAVGGCAILLKPRNAA